MILTLFDRDKAFDLVLPERVTGRYILKTEDKENNPIDMLAVEGEDGQWYLKSNKYAYIKNTSNEVESKVLIEPFKTYTICRDNDQSALLYVEPQTIDRNEYTKHIATSNLIKIGRSQDSQICFSNKLVSGSHCVIEYGTNGDAVIKDFNSSNGTYVNGQRVKEKELSIGDVIFIMGLKIIFNGRLLSLNNPHKSVFLDRNAFNPFVSEKPVIEKELNLDEIHFEEENSQLFYRSPRFKRDIEKTTIKIDPPPQQPNLEDTPLMLLLGPSITMGMASLFTGLLTLQNVMRTDGNIMTAMPTLVMSLSMLIGTVLWPILTKKYEKKRRVKLEGVRQEKYKAYLKDMKQVIADECKHQSEILFENHVTLENCVTRIKRRQRNLWERGIGQNDFLKVRLGIGDLPLNAEIKYPEKRFMLEDDNLQDELYEIVEKPQILKEVPVTADFTEEQISGIIGRRDEVKSFVQGVIFQLAALHSYDELKLVFIYDEHEHDTWKFVKWLPHVWDDGKTIRFVATDANEIKELSAYFEKEISARQMMADEDLAEISQHYVVFSMSKSLAAKAEMINQMLKEKKKIRFSLIALYDELKNLPKECTNVIELDKSFS
ncbi:MAG: FHA domain-containing protein, partial [Mesobacillus sp.]|uniref:FHA domain-containing protein n=1 Tax=Mesobacillus sp. TaxID=2675271 RepID=UPI003C567471